jgi:hypothetical protein
MSNEGQSAWDKAVEEMKRPRTLQERVMNKICRLLPKGLAAHVSGDLEQRISLVLEDFASKRSNVRFMQIRGL